MRKYLFPLLFAVQLSANPILIPQAFISELYFDNQQAWQLEILLDLEEGNFDMIDSIVLASTSGTAVIKPETFNEESYLYVIDTSVLMRTLHIAPSGDIVKIITYWGMGFGGETIVDSLRFGSVPGSKLDTLMDGYSFSRIDYNTFAKDKTPTLGVSNDTSGTCGTLCGSLLDIEDEQIPRGKFKLDNELLFREDGTFITRVYARRFMHIRLAETIGLYGYKSHAIDTLRCNINPDSMIQQDIRILADYVVGIRNKADDPPREFICRVYPNPFNTRTIFYLDGPDSENRNGARIRIFNVRGQQVTTLVPDQGNSIAWNGTDQNGTGLPSGIYFYKVSRNEYVYASGSLVLLK